MKRDMDTLEDIVAAIGRGLPAQEAIGLLDEWILCHGDDEEAYIRRGMLHWSCNHRALAINDYHSAIAINPDSRARQVLQSVNDILDYYNKDLYNP